MSEQDPADLDFDTWAGLARDEPERFEALRQAAIDAVIEGAPEANRERLRRLQWRIDQERRLARTPMAACLQISRMMWDRVLGEGGLRERLTEMGDLLQGRPGSRPVHAAAPARVLRFGHQDRAS